MRAGLFPGQGIDAATVARALPPDHELVARASSILDYDLTRKVEQIARTPRATLPTRLAQPAIFVAGLVSFEAAVASDRRFHRLAGHSLGEYTALAAADSIPFAMGLDLVAKRGAAMQRATLSLVGGMAAVQGLSLEEAEDVADAAGVTLANDNSATQVVLSGREGALRQAAEMVRDRGGRSLLLAVEGAFHSSAMEPAVGDLTDALDQVDIRMPRVPVVSNVSARPYRSPGEIRKLLVEQLTSRVRFRECISWLADRGVIDFVDLGPGRVVGKLARDTVAKLPEAANA